MIRKCKHGIFWPLDQEIALYCQSCNPAGNPDRDNDAPKFNRRGSLNMTETGKLPRCPNCEFAIITVSSGGQCPICKAEYTIEAPSHLRANNSQSGICLKCGSGVHYDRGREWECSECGELYKAPRRPQ